MCFNSDVSMATYITGIIGCLLLIRHELYIEALFYFWVLQMQLIEFVLWNNKDCGEINKLTTKIGLVINHLEPIILWIGVLLFSKKIIPEWIHYLMIIYFISTILYSSNVYKNDCTQVTEESKPHLLWKWNLYPYQNYYYLFFLITLNILAIYGVEYGYHMAFLVTTSFIISSVIYNKTNTIGAMWCFAAAFAPLITPLVYQINLS